jgi:hypothetical protein
MRIHGLLDTYTLKVLEPSRQRSYTIKIRYWVKVLPVPPMPMPICALCFCQFACICSWWMKHNRLVKPWCPMAHVHVHVHIHRQWWCRSWLVESRRCKTARYSIQTVPVPRETGHKKGWAQIQRSVQVQGCCTIVVIPAETVQLLDGCKPGPIRGEPFAKGSLCQGRWANYNANCRYGINIRRLVWISFRPCRQTVPDHPRNCHWDLSS